MQRWPDGPLRGASWPDRRCLRVFRQRHPANPPPLGLDGALHSGSCLPTIDETFCVNAIRLGKGDGCDPRRQRYAAALGSVTHTLRLGGGTLVRPPWLRPNRLRLIAAASGLMTESASRSSRSTHASTPGLAPEHAAMLRRGAIPAWWRNTGQRSVESEPRIPSQYSNSTMARQPARWCACAVRSPRPCSTSFGASGRPVRSTSPAGDSTPTSSAVRGFAM